MEHFSDEKNILHINYGIYSVVKARMDRNFDKGVLKLYMKTKRHPNLIANKIQSNAVQSQNIPLIDKIIEAYCIASVKISILGEEKTLNGPISIGEVLGIILINLSL